MGNATSVEAALQDFAADIMTLLPRILGAVLVLIIGWIVGRAAGRIVRVLADRSEIDRMTMNTPIGRMIGGTERSISMTLGKIARWFVYALAVLAAADVLAIEMLSQWISAAVSYLPAFLGGLLFILFGFIVADFIGDMIQRTQAATRTRYTRYFADGVRMFLYFTAIVIGLDTMGINVDFLYIIARALTWGLALALALAVGIGAGWGSKDYVADNIDRWMRKGREKSQEMRDSGE
jgi:preprotein translocase subunit SecF